MKSRLLNKTVPVYREPNPNSTLLGVLRPSDEFTVREPETYQGKKWVSVTLNTGISGYISGVSELHPIQDAILQQSEVQILAAPDSHASVKQTGTKGMAFMHAGVVVQNGAKWIEVRTPSGMIGFIPENTKYKLAETAKGKLKAATAAAATIGVINLIIGLIGSLADSRVLPGWEALLSGALFTILAYFISERSRAALGIAAGLWGIGLLIKILTFLSTVTNHSAVNYNPGVLAISLMIGVGLLRLMIQGFPAISELKNPDSLPSRPGPFVDWIDNTSENKPSEISAAPDYQSIDPTPFELPAVVVEQEHQNHYSCPHCGRSIAAGATTCMFCWGKTALSI
jgi:hypothetical protein